MNEASSPGALNAKPSLLGTNQSTTGGVKKKVIPSGGKGNSGSVHQHQLVAAAAGGTIHHSVSKELLNDDMREVFSRGSHQK